MPSRATHVAQAGHPLPQPPARSGGDDAPRAVAANQHAATPQGRYLLRLSLAALGIVYGDIGTSPLYSLRESFTAEHGVAPTPANVLGVLSLIFWSLII